MRLLIAEDEVDLAEALTAFFEKNQFAVDSVHNGFDAYEYGSSGEYDAIILDVMMPKMNGVEVLQKLRAEGIKTPIMMLTAKAEKDDRITGFNAGADDYLPKRVWGWDSDAEINVVWVHISNLRKKIKSIGSGVTITANRGMGYLLEETK